MATNRNLDLFSLECFDTLMRERSVSRAAERMDMSQSSMSEVLARLRDRLGDPLLVRTREGMVPTDRATVLLPQVRQAIDQMRLIVARSIEFQPGQAVERFRLTATDYAQLLLVPALAHRLRGLAPQCTLDLVTINIRLVEQALETGEVDLAIAYYPDPPPGLRRGPLFADRYACIVRHGHPAATRPLTGEGFAELAHVSVSPSGLSYFADVVDSALDAQGLARRVVVKCPHFLIASHLVAHSDMVLALPERAARALTGFLPVQIVDLPFATRPVDVSMYWHERCHHSRSHQWLREQVRALLVPAPA